MTDFNIGRRINEFVIQEQDLGPFLDAGFTRDWMTSRDSFTYASVFIEDTDVQAYLFLLKYYDNHSRVPTRELFDRNFPTYFPEISQYSPDELIKEAHATIKSAIVGSLIDDFHDLDREGQYDAALEKIKEAGSQFDIPLTDWEFELGVQAEVRKLRQSREARIRLDTLNDEWTVPTGYSVTDLATLAEGTRWRMQGLLANGANMVLNASHKSGKSTLVLNMVYALLEGAPFLGEYETERVERIRVLDMEMPVRTGHRWLVESGLDQYGDRLKFSFLAGTAGHLSLLNDTRRRMIADDLMGTDVLIIDPLGPVMAAHGMEENSNTDIRRLLNGLSQLKREARISELIVVHHSGHAASRRSRGASVLGDWPDVIVSLRNENPELATGVRKFSAVGRDINIEEKALTYTAATHQLVTFDHGARTREATLKSRVIASLVDAGKPMGANEIVAAVRKQRKPVLATIRELVDAGSLNVTEAGPGLKNLYTLNV